MKITVGDRVPDATFLTMGAEDLDPVASADVLGRGRVVLFGMPGAFTATCSAVHVPSILAALDDVRAKGVDTVAILTANDPFTLDAWGKMNGASDAGIVLLADPESNFIKAIGTAFSAPARGLIDRSMRFAAIIEDGVVTAFDIEEGRGSCDLTGGTAILDRLRADDTEEPHGGDLRRSSAGG